MHTKQWLQDEMATLDLGEPRRNRRLIQLISDIAEHPEASVPEACGSWSATKAAYRFWDNQHVEADAIRNAHQQGTFNRLSQQGDASQQEDAAQQGDAAQQANSHQQETILILQDTTNLDFTSQPNNKKHTAQQQEAHGTPGPLESERVETAFRNGRHSRWRATRHPLPGNMGS